MLIIYVFNLQCVLLLLFGVPEFDMGSHYKLITNDTVSIVNAVIQSNAHRPTIRLLLELLFNFYSVQSFTNHFLRRNDNISFLRQCSLSKVWLLLPSHLLNLKRYDKGSLYFRLHNYTKRSSITLLVVLSILPYV